MLFFLSQLIICSIGFISIAIVMDKHHRTIFSSVLSEAHKKIFIIVGWVMLFASLFAAIYIDGIANGISYWLGIITFSALSVLLILSYYADHLKRLIIKMSNTKAV